MSLSLPGIINAYNYICLLQNQNSLVNNFKDCFKLFSACNIDRSPDSIQAAGKKLLELFKSLKQIQFEVKIPALNSKQFVEYQEGIGFIREIQNINTPASLRNLILKIQTAAKAFFPTPDQVSSELAREGELLFRKWETTKMCQGLVELYELTTRQYLPEQQSIQDAVVPVLVSLKKLISSFAESNKTISEEEGKEMLYRASFVVANHKDQIKALCAENSCCSKLIDVLVSISKNRAKIHQFYSVIKDELIECCRAEESSNTIKPEDLMVFFQERAKIAFSALPNELKPDIRVLAQKLAEAFKTQEDHGNGMLVSGQESINSTANQYFGDGLAGGIPEHTRPINPYNSMSRDLIENTKVRQKIEELGKSIAENYYKKHKLQETEFIVGGNVITEEPIHDPIDQALGTVNLIIQYELSQYIEENGLLFGLEENRKERLMPEISKKVILFGIDRDIFNEEQVGVLIRKYKIADDDQIKNAISIALTRQFVRAFRQSQKDEEKKLP
jgi:hypothetical protein